MPSTKGDRDAYIARCVNDTGVQVEQLALSKQNVYVLSTKGEVYVRCGICDKFPIGSRWSLLAGNCRLLSGTNLLSIRPTFRY